MTSIYVEVDLEDYLDEMDTEDLIDELETRGMKIVGHSAMVSADRVLAEMLRSAFYRRDASRFEALLVAHLDPLEAKKPQLVVSAP